MVTVPNNQNVFHLRKQLFRSLVVLTLLLWTQLRNVFIDFVVVRRFTNGLVFASCHDDDDARL